MSLARRKLQKVGNSTGVVLPAPMLREAGLEAGDEVMVRHEDGRLVIVPLDTDFDDAVRAAEGFIADHPNALKKLAE
jgi:putative addiction module antidote